MGNCGTCVHWQENAQGKDDGRGNCARIGDQDSEMMGEVGDGLGTKSPLAFAQNGDGTVASWLETAPGFGCVEHEAK
jgi:hypothetical protein